MQHFSMRCRRQCRALRPLKIHYMSRDQPKAHELTNHILHPSPAPIRRSPGAPENVLRRWYGMVPVSSTAQVVRYGACVINGNHRKFAEDTLNGNDVQDWFLVVKLIKHPRADRFQPSCTEEHGIMSISAITCISVITCISTIMAITCISVIMAKYNHNMHNMYNCYNVYHYHYQDHRMFPRLRRGHTRRSWIQCPS